MVALGHPVLRHLTAAAVLVRLSSDAPGALGRWGAHEVSASLTAFDSGGRSVPARLYTPRGVESPPGLVLVHGVHHLGIEEPRLVRFARTLASAGIDVFTPQVQELADYAVDAKSIDTLGAAAQALSRRLAGQPRVGVMGLSFAGGLALLTAADPRYADDVAFVVAVGAHDDLARVSRFFALDSVESPDGTRRALRAHPYGPLVLVYSHASEFFPDADVPAVKEALRLWLWEDPAGARRAGATVSEASRAKLDALLTDHVDALRSEMLASIDRNQSAMAAVSPAGRLGRLRIPVLLLHGAGDTVIPASETLWLAREVPPEELRGALVSPALQHVELEGQPGWKDEWALIHFMASVLEQTRAETAR
jgi:dienelactone hydrolase